MGEIFDFVPNYTGPYLSNGKIQSSVAFGDRKPKDALDAYSRLHDSAYAKWNDRLHLTVADEIYYEQVNGIGTRMASVAGEAVLYGNHIARSFNNLTSSFVYGPVGLVVGAVRNGLDLQDYLSNRSSIRDEILTYYDKDPYKESEGFRPRSGSKMIRNAVNPVYPWININEEKPKHPHPTSDTQPKNNDVVVYGAEEPAPGNATTFVNVGSTTPVKNTTEQNSSFVYNPSSSAELAVGPSFSDLTAGLFPNKRQVFKPFWMKRFKKKKKNRIHIE